MISYHGSLLLKCCETVSPGTASSLPERHRAVHVVNRSCGKDRGMDRGMKSPCSSRFRTERRGGPTGQHSRRTALCGALSCCWVPGPRCPLWTGRGTAAAFRAGFSVWVDPSPPPLLSPWLSRAHLLPVNPHAAISGGAPRPRQACPFTSRASSLHAAAVGVSHAPRPLIAAAKPAGRPADGPCGLVIF